MTATLTPIAAADVAIPAHLPWANWEAPTVETDVPVQALTVRPTTDGLWLDDDERPLGRIGTHGLRELSTRVGFPIDFIEKLSTRTLQAEVINDRIAQAREQDFSVVCEGDRILNVAPGWRAVTPHALVAQVAYDEIATRVGAVEVGPLAVGPNGLSLKLITSTERPVTPRIGDVLRMGVQISHRYGMELGVSLFTERLVCLNGMTGTRHDFDWTHRSMGTVDSQLSWLRDGVDHAIESYGDLIARAQRMAETQFQGSHRDAIIERARAMGVPRRLWEQIIRAFEEEPGQDEWALLNAFTRFATHSTTADLSRRLQAAAGDWATNFDVVTARLPRATAMRVGASIIQEIDAIGAAADA